MDIYKIKKQFPAIAYFMFILVCLGTCVGEGVVTLNKTARDDIRWKKEQAIRDFYDQQQCVKAGCEDPEYTCREYCYDKLTQPKE